jgi:hypothetical protein
MYNTDEEKLIVKGSERITRDLLVNHDAYINGGIEANNVTTNELNVANMVAGGVTVNDLNVVNQVENLNVANLVGNNIVEGENRVVNNAILGMDTQSVVFWNNTANQFQTLPVPYADNVVLTGNVDGSLRWAIGGGGNVNGAPVVVMNESYFIDVLDYNVDNGWDNSVLYMTTPNGNFFFGNYFYAPTAVYVSPTVVTMVFNSTAYSGNVTLSLSKPDAVTNAFLGSSSIISATYKNGQPASIGVNMSLPNSCVTNAKYLYVENAAYAFNTCIQMNDCFFFNEDLIENRPAEYNPWSKISNAHCMFNYCYNLNKGTFIIPENAVDVSMMYSHCSNIGWSHEQINVSDTVENMYSTFSNCMKYNSPIIIGNNVTNMANTFAGCMFFNQPITIPDSVTDMSNTFTGCLNFNSPIVIGNNVTNMRYTFTDCINFNQPLNIPDSVTNMWYTFTDCRSLNSLITLGNNVVDIKGTFRNCWTFNSPITLGNNIVDMEATFYSCYNFNQPITIPDSVTDMSYTFQDCHNLNSPITIGNNVRDMSYAFYNCSSFNQPIIIPENVTNLYKTFLNCDKLSGNYAYVVISRNIAIGNTSNYIYNALVNGYTGINWYGRIRNDA